MRFVAFLLAAPRWRGCSHASTLFGGFVIRGRVCVPKA